MEEELGYGDSDGSVIVVGSDVRSASDLNSAGEKSKTKAAYTVSQDDQDKNFLFYGGLCLAGILLLLIINKR